MVDLARAMIQVGEDPHDVLERARRIMLECDAKLFLFEIDEVLAELDARDPQPPSASVAFSIPQTSPTS